MSILSKLRRSRDNWKQKAKERAETIRYQRKENLRIKKEREHYKQLARELKDQLKKERKKNAPICNKEELVHISLNLFLTARISFRAVSRVLGVLGDKLGISKAPCPQTVINWVTRLSIARVKNSVQPDVPQIIGDRFSNGYIWMIDASIGLGAGKILALLALNTYHHDLNEGAPTIEKVQCIGVSVASSWTGESIADFLQRNISVKGRPAAYLKDGGTDLAKALRILDKRGISSPSIDDVSHVSANLLKHEYKNHPMFNTFISACGKASKNLKQTLLACLAPPKVSTKARFMNLHRLVKWADQLLKHSPKGRAPKKSALSKLRAGIGNLPKCKPFIKRFLRDANPLLDCQKTLKNKGLNQDTYEQCKKLLKTIPPRSNVRKGFTAWAEKQLKVADELGLGKTGMPISSDTIESVFGVAKQHGAGTIKDANHIARRIPALVGKVTKEDARQVLSISVKEQQEAIGSLPSLTKQRRDILPNPGNLEDILVSGKRQYFELISGGKKWAKNLININISECCKKSKGPPIASENQEAVPMEASVCMA
jgi:hypothetical protein